MKTRIPTGIPKMKFALALLAIVPTLVSSVVVPGASTPEFYLVSASNLLPVLVTGTPSTKAAVLGSPGSSSPAAKFYFSQGGLKVVDPNSSTPDDAFIEEFPQNCDPFGALRFQKGPGTSNKCAKFSGFSLQSDTENSQLGAQLVFNGAGAFYECAGSAVFWKNSPGLGPSGCTPVSLYTVPVV